MDDLLGFIQYDLKVLLARHLTELNDKDCRADECNGFESDDGGLSIRMIERRALATARPRSAWVRPHVQVHAMSRHVVVFAMCHAMHLAGLKIPVLHPLAHMLWMMVEPCELLTVLVALTRHVQDPFHVDIKQITQCVSELSQCEHF